MSKLSQGQVVAVVKGSPMFSALDAAAARGFVGDCRTIHLPAGRLVFHAGQEADRFYVVLSGRVKIFKLSARGDEQILHLYGPGETFAEAAMWAGADFPAHAEAVSEATLLVISRSTLRRAIERSPELAMGMMAGLSAKLREFNQLIEELSLKEVPARLAGVLLRMSRRGGSRRLRLSQTKRQLAAQIGTVAETLSRALAKMKASALIDVHGSQITLLDLSGLEELAANG